MGFRIKDLGLRVEDMGVGFMVYTQNLGFRVRGFRFKV
jgi:hypothetical protein